MNALWRLALPELPHVAPGERRRALQYARATPLDLVESLGMAAGVALVTALTRWVAPDAGSLLRAAGYLVDFTIAAPLLVVVLGPFHVRRLRRGLRARLSRDS